MSQLCEDDGLHDRLLRGKVVQRDASGRVSAIGDVSAGECRIRFPTLATFAFRPGEAKVRVGVAASVPREVVEKLFVTAALPFVLQAEGYEALHASAVQTAGGVVACCGFSGSGKTTVAYALARRRHRLWADDALVWSPSAGREAPLTFRLPNAVKLRPASRRFFGLEHGIGVDVESATSDEDRLAAVVVLDPEPGADLDVAQLPLDAALTAVLPHAFCFFAADGCERRTTAAYLDLAARIPVLRFRFQTDFVDFDHAVDLLEERLSHTRAGA
jgi:hypothetical protein